MTYPHQIVKGLFSVLLVAVLASCEDVISPALQQAVPILVVDGWIDNRMEMQTITLTQSQPYFDAVTPPGVTGAVVSVVDGQGMVYVFAENTAKPGAYEWTPSAIDVLADGERYRLVVTIGSEVFEATSKMGRVPQIDSISFEKDEQLSTGDEITRGEFWATEPIGIGDAYWIRTYKNGIPLLKPSELNIAFDAGPSIGAQTDGVTFIAPVRRRINSNDEDADGVALSPISSGDSVQVQIHSITTAAFTYLTEVGIQTNRPGGFQELFSTPLANVSTNIVNTNPGGSKVVGFFNVAAVSTAGKRYIP